MSRRRKPVERKILPDPEFGNIVLSKFINCIMKKGKKSIAEKIVYSSLDIIAKKTKKDPLEIFETALINVQPQVRVISKRIGGSNYQVPREVNAKNGQAIAFRWIIQIARARKEKSMQERLAAELFSAYNKDGASIKKKEDTHKMAEANKAFAHLRW